MNVTQQGIITLLKSAVTGQTCELPKEFALDAEETIKFIKKHHLMQLIYVGATNCGIPSDIPVMKSLFASYYKQLLHSKQQMAEVKKVFQIFEQYEIDYMPTKGCNMKSLYPQPEMRVMGDADIFIRKEQCPEIKRAMTELGFTQSLENVYNDVWDNEHLHLELHKRMGSYYNESYYDDVWSRVKLVDGCRYAFSTEDAFIHIFNHFARHYRGGGIGCRHVLDLYVYRQAFPKMDETYIMQEMEKLHLHEFYKNMRILLDVWFADAAPTEATETITQYIFRSGNWGTLGSSAIARQVKLANNTGTVSHSKLKAIVTAVFPSRKFMTYHYPILEKVPYLLPFTWILRGARVLFIDRDHIKWHTQQWRVIKDDRVKKFQEQFKIVGLDLEEQR